jgi:hypothetical protein
MGCEIKGLTDELIVFMNQMFVENIPTYEARIGNAWRVVQ